jgi:uroporphyrinogen-III synthase
VRDIYLLNGERYEGVKSVKINEIIELNPPFIQKHYDAVIFTSKNAVLSIDKIYKEWTKLPSYSIGKGTSETIRKLGGQVAYEAKNSYGDGFAFEIAPLLFDKTALFPRAKKTASDVGGVLRAANVSVHELIVYESVCKENISLTPKDDAIFIFTAPSIVKCFLKLVKWRGGFTAVAIGEKTAAAFPSDIKPLISPKQTIEACVDFAKTLSKNYI